MNEPNLKDVELVVLVVVDEAAPSLGNGHVHQMICLHILTFRQCCGSGSTGSTGFWGLPDPDPLVRGIDPDPDPDLDLDPDPDPSIIMQKQ
jgi:hypothetical protein